MTREVGKGSKRVVCEREGGVCESERESACERERENKCERERGRDLEARSQQAQLLVLAPDLV